MHDSESSFNAIQYSLLHKKVIKISHDSDSFKGDMKCAVLLKPNMRMRSSAEIESAKEKDSCEGKSVVEASEGSGRGRKRRGEKGEECCLFPFDWPFIQSCERSCLQR